MTRADTRPTKLVPTPGIAPLSDPSLRGPAYPQYAGYPATAPRSLAPTMLVTWEKLPTSYVLPDDPVDNINQPYLAAALTESLELAGYLPETALTPTNYGICATVDGQLVVKAPDWAYVPRISVPPTEIQRSYTPLLQGDPLLLVLEFLSATEGEEFSLKPTYPPGKWFFYEQVLQVPYYGIFEPESGDLALHYLGADGRYHNALRNEFGQYWIEEMTLGLAAWCGLRGNREGWWLRWWDESNQILPWGREQVAEERQRAEEERQRAEEERQRADRLAAKLRSLGLDPDT